MDRYITLSQAALRDLYCLSLADFRWRRPETVFGQP